MMKLKQRFLSLLLAVCLLAGLLPTTAAAAEVIASGDFGNGFHWSLNSEGTFTITGAGDMPNLGYYPWEKHKDQIVTVIIEEGVTSVGERAFYGCSNLAQVELPAGLTSIGYNAFEGCKNLALTKLPASLTSIGIGAFYGCESLELTKLPNSVTSIGNAAFAMCFKLALTELPAGLISIGDDAFSNCKSLALEELPAGLTSIENGVFYGCESLALTKLPVGLTSIEDDAFSNCKSLALEELPAGVTSIGVNAFSGCESLALTKLPAGVTSIGYNAFEGCINLALEELPAGLTSIEDYAFFECESLVLTKLPAGVASIGYNAFKGCKNLALKELPAGLTSIKDNAFKGCESLALKEIPASVASIGNSAFSGCSALTELTFTRENAPELGTSAFVGCDNLTIYIPSNSSGYADGANWSGIQDKVAVAYAITINTTTGGTASASRTSAAAGTSITLTAEANSGYHFQEWQVISGGVTINGDSFTMPAANVTIKAIFAEDTLPSPTEYTVTVKGSYAAGSGAGDYAEGATVAINAGNRGDYTFSGWTTTASAVTLANAASPSTTFVMPAQDVLITANWVYNGGSSSSGGSWDYTPAETDKTEKAEKVENSEPEQVKPEKINTETISPFADVQASDWFYDAVRFVYDKKIMTGTTDNTFSPYGTATRGMMAAVIWRMEGSPKAAVSGELKDVSADSYYAEAVNWAVARGIFNGYGDGIFAPDNHITREQLAAIFYNYAKYKGEDLTAANSLAGFADQDSISDWARGVMEWAVGRGLISGRGDGILDGQGTATRAEIAAMLHRLLEQ